MNRSLRLKAPIVTLLSSSPALSRKAQHAMKYLFSMNTPDLENSMQDDELDVPFRSAIPGFTKEWDSVVCQCPSTRTIVHFVSLRNANDPNATGWNDSLELLSVVGSANDDSVTASVQKSRNAIGSRLASFSRATAVALKHASGQQITPHDILGFGGGLPLLDLTENSPTKTTNVGEKGLFLRELAIPLFDDSVYEDGSTMQQKLSESLQRPVVGVYKFHNGLALRPLPAAKEDRVLPGPSLVFQCQDAEELNQGILERGGQTAKIGFSGTSKSGQRIVLHSDLPGLDVRLDDTSALSSSFSEAQDALLAGSLEELQNVNVLLEGGKDGVETRSKLDAMNGVGDCWVEFRANVKKPFGFMKRSASGVAVTKTKGNKIAKAPILPYE